MSTTNSSKKNTSGVVRVDQLDIRDVAISPLRVLKDKRLSAYLKNTNSESNLYETPNLFTNGLLKYEAGGGAPSSISLPLSKYASNGESMENVEKFFSYLSELDNTVITYILYNSQLIFKKQYTQEQKPIVEALFTKGISQNVGKNGITYTSMKLKFQKNIIDGVAYPEVMIFEGRKNLNVRTFEDIENILLGRKTPIRVIFQPRIYFMGGKCGITYYVTQILIPERKVIEAPKDFAFSGYENETDVSESPLENIVVEESKEIEKKNEDAEDSEEEEEEEEEEDDEEEN
jgi:hypothetical protein